MSLLIAFAFPLECRKTVALLGLKGQEDADAGTIYCGDVSGRAVAVGCTGVGRWLAFVTCRRLIERTRPQRILFSGFAGALVPGLAVGDLICPDRVMLESGDDSAAAPADPALPDADLAAAIARAAAATDLTLHRRPLVTVDRVVRDSAAKRSLASVSDAIAVDMESAASLDCAREHGIPCAVVRSISDDVDDSIPEGIGGVLDAAGKPIPSEIARISAQPELFAALRRLGANGEVAGESLARCLQAYIAT